MERFFNRHSDMLLTNCICIDMDAEDSSPTKTNNTPISTIILYGYGAIRILYLDP